MALESLRPEEFTPVIDFYFNLKRENKGIWKDSQGEYVLAIGHSLLRERLLTLGDSQVLCPAPIKQILGNAYKDDDRQNSTLVSIGSFKMHNLARQRCIAEKRKFVTVPIPLANDSFGTNRMSADGQCGSVQSLFPMETLFDLDLIEIARPADNLLGLGEFVGLYISILDYFSVRKKTVPVEILKIINEQVDRYFSGEQNCWGVGYTNLLADLSADLTFKCLIMRANGDHQIGCGMDHLIGGVLEKSLQIPHGQAVFLASIISLFIFPCFEDFGLTANKLLKLNEKYQILSADLIARAARMDPLVLIQNALGIRPNRMSILKIASSSQIGASWAKFDCHIS